MGYTLIVFSVENTARRVALLDWQPVLLILLWLNPFILNGLPALRSLIIIINVYRLCSNQLIIFARVDFLLSILSVEDGFILLFFDFMTRLQY